MGSSTIKKGDNLCLDDGLIDIFGAKGTKLHNGKWAVDFGLGMLVEVEPAPAADLLQQVVNEDLFKGKKEKIDCIKVSPTIAVRLFLDGTIDRNSVENAEAQDDTIIFPGAKVQTVSGKLEFKVVVDRAAKLDVVTLDTEGNIV